MPHLPIVTACGEGGYYSPHRDPEAPIRIYSDRRVRDDIYTRATGVKFRKRLSRSEYRDAVRWSKINRARGVV
jgi:hypothetical protein